MRIQYKTTFLVSATPNHKTNKVDSTIEDLNRDNTPAFCAKQVTEAMFMLARIAYVLNPLIISDLPEFKDGYSTKLKFEFINEDVTDKEIKVRANSNNMAGALLLRSLLEIRNKNPEAIEAFGFSII